MGGHGFVRIDPAIERWIQMRGDTYKHFRWTPRTTLIGIYGLILFPGLIYTIASTEYIKWDWVGKRKGESLLRNPPPPAPVAEEE
ncbi:hypothetical protein OBBRIDRAFT_745853 [Obba rivulosa]|uniref:NADH dehydrogenase [ubiquinone] 1 beta subcomplex subunit 4 n=1 Tax=Obba rivulosa TaxID=1052685 RepID=A0A8E2J5J7_9APHY|nr:hypothetical protein OBBRIDRAFT_745853 [Obba rivulosa]